MPNPQPYDHSGLEILILIIAIACMRGCYHVGVIAEKIAPDVYEQKAEK